MLVATEIVAIIQVGNLNCCKQLYFIRLYNDNVCVLYFSSTR